MPSLKLQPTFTLELPLSAQAAIDQISRSINRLEFKEAKSAGHCAEFGVAPGEKRFWSPHLSVQVTEAESGENCVLLGRFSPRPEIWTFLMLVYFMMTFFLIAGGIFGYVQWSMGTSPWAFALVPLGLVIIGVIHVVSLIGQRLSEDQMADLRGQLDQTLA